MGDDVLSPGFPEPGGEFCECRRFDICFRFDGYLDAGEVASDGCAVGMQYFDLVSQLSTGS